ncbi:MAG: hypothetical protein ACK6A9_19065 [Dolichospermum sp.]|jgi:hypothetical protein
MSNNDRETTFSFKRLLSEFNELEGYYNLNNDQLASQLKELNLLGVNVNAENKVDDPDTIAIYKKWSFTVSFLQMLNAWQWFFAGILLERNSYLTTQAMQMYYYAIFFSYGSFLSAHFKGHYTVKDELKTTKNKKIKNNEIFQKFGNETARALMANVEDKDMEEIIVSSRRYVWLVDNPRDGKYIYVKAKNEERGGEHERRSKWYYGVFTSWESKINISYPEVRYFKEDDYNTLHPKNRNMYTYSIQHMVDELYYEDEDTALNNEGIICLWQRKSNGLSEAFSTEFWTLQHIKVVVDLHTKLLEKYNKDSPYTEQQEHLLRNLCEHHKRTGLVEVLKVAMPTILEKIGI